MLTEGQRRLEDLTSAALTKFMAEICSQEESPTRPGFCQKPDNPYSKVDAACCSDLGDSCSLILGMTLAIAHVCHDRI